MMHISDLLQKLDSQLPERKFYGDGAESLSSRVRRAVAAHRIQKGLDAENPALAVERRARLAADDAEQRTARAAENEQEFWTHQPRMLEAMGLRPQELEAVAGMDETWPAAIAVRKWWAGTSLFLTLGGETGTGKTVAAACLCCEAFERVRSESFEGRFWRPGWARFVKANELARLSYFAAEDRNWLEHLAVVRYLAIDDLGAELASTSFGATLEGLVDARARNKVRTVLTTNLDSKTFEARYGARVWRRIKDFGDMRRVARGAA